MDPEANLREQRRLTRRLLAEFDASVVDAAEWHPAPDDVYRLAELADAMDTWLSRGGASPHAWRGGFRPPEPEEPWPPLDDDVWANR